MKIRTKIIVLVSVVLAINLLSGSFFTIQYIRLQNELNTLLQKNLFLSNNLLRLTYNQSEQHMLLEKALKTGENYAQGQLPKSQFTKSIKAFRESYQNVKSSLEFEKKIKNFEFLEPDSSFTTQLTVLDQTLIEIASWHEANYEASEEILNSFLLMRNTTSHADSIKAQLMESELIISQNLMYLYQEFEKFTKKSTENLELKEKKLIQYSVAVVLVSFLAGLGLAFWLYQGIQNSLSNAVSFARKITAGEKDIRIDKIPKDETGELLNALSMMTHSLQLAENQLKSANEELHATNEELLTTNETLEEKVMERTNALEESNQKLKSEVFEKQSITDELNTFLYRVSHDLQGPAASIRGLIHLFHFDFEEAVANGYLDKISERLTHLEAVFQSLTFISQLENRYLNLSKIDFREVWEEVKTSMQHLENAKDVLLRFYDNYEGKWIGDKTILNHIFKALVSNAITYCRPAPFGSYCSVEISKHAEGLRISVTDNGIGMNPLTLSHIFRMFYRGNDSSKGKGLDLYMVKKGVKALNGSIEVISRENEGTTFTITFPNLTKPHFFEKIASTPQISQSNEKQNC